MELASADIPGGSATELRAGELLEPSQTQIAATAAETILEDEEESEASSILGDPNLDSWNASITGEETLPAETANFTETVPVDTLDLWAHYEVSLPNITAVPSDDDFELIEEEEAKKDRDNNRNGRWQRHADEDNVDDG